MSGLIERAFQEPNPRPNRRLARLLYKIEENLKAGGTNGRLIPDFSEVLVLFDLAESMGVPLDRYMDRTKCRCFGEVEVHVSLRTRPPQRWSSREVAYWRAGWSRGLWDPASNATTRLYKAEKAAGRAGIETSLVSKDHARQVAAQSAERATQP